METEWRDRAARLTTAHIADACLRVGVEVRCAPAALRPLASGTQLAGRVLPARHVGSVDVFLEALESALVGDVLVVDNGGRTDEACVGDLIAHEAQLAGLQGLLIWGLHRDTVDLTAIGLPIFSLGALPAGPLRLDARPTEALASAQVGSWTVDTSDAVFADDDGALFVPVSDLERVLTAAETIRDAERAQADRIRGGESLRDQLGFSSYLAARASAPELTFRAHLRAVGGAIEE